MLAECYCSVVCVVFFFSSRRRHTRCALVTGVQTCALPIFAEFLLANLRRPDGRWLRSWQAEAGGRHLAYATDHGALLDAFTRLAEATGQARWIDEARSVADALIDLF